ncbi:hypothetical protein HMPREF0454_00107 [Hafnia alvei ATCC 51873]|uniref:Uncharacterized protein n=1 Tax=Hafnia alvei ATCC 51873 TaxID=1002364 RepID=G9Y0P9_HAFAL|nr:hypothetical protein HMPREF0454_00107 [Hafnia alvei ATCC 51873]
MNFLFIKLINNPFYAIVLHLAEMVYFWTLCKRKKENILGSVLSKPPINYLISELNHT